MSSGSDRMSRASRRAPARAGDALGAIDTPALLLDLDAFQANLSTVQREVAVAGGRLRPHGKAHRCAEIALRQIRAGAVGICCQKLTEAEIFVDAGVGDVLISNQVVGERKADRVALLARRARVAVCVDSPVHVEQLARAARARAAHIDLMIEVDVGQGRCGVTEPSQALALARQIAAASPWLRLRGLQAYHGRAQHQREPWQRRDSIARAAAIAREVRDALALEGSACDEVSGGGTGSYPCELASGVYTEIQAGSYVLMDADYAANTLDDGQPALRQALIVLTTVISARPGHAVLDAGLKSMSAESGLPACAEPGWSTMSISDEHLVLRKTGAGRELSIGDMVRVVPSHCDPTVNLHDFFVVIAGDRVEAIWPVDARGASG